MELRDLWEEADLLTDEGILKKLMVFLSLILTEYIVGPILYWWLEERKKENKDG